MAKRVIVTIKADGDHVNVETEGYKGTGCKAVHDAFTFGKVTKETLKPEYHQPAGNLQTQKMGR